MKKLLTITFVLFTLSTVFAQITNSAHDFSGESWNSSGEICITCHTPHNANTTANTPLWNHVVTSATFTPYDNPTLDADVSAGPSGSSKLCLSCHDGTVALDNFGGTTDGTNFISGNALLGSDLSNDHPVSFTYDAALVTADGALNDPTAAPIADLLIDGKMECASCHNAHGAGNNKFLRIANTGSALCITCHNK